MIDYRQLLVRYMAQVLDCEGVNFVHNEGHDGTFLSKEDKAELSRIEIDAQKLYKAKS